MTTEYRRGEVYDHARRVPREQGRREGRRIIRNGGIKRVADRLSFPPLPSPGRRCPRGATRLE
jgi:hypothetical protein